MLLAIEWVGGDFVAIAAILVGGIVSLVAVTMTGRNDKQARKDERRFEVYSVILTLVRRVTDQASQYAYGPGGTIVTNPDHDEFHRAASQLKLVGTDQVHDAFRDWQWEVSSYWPPEDESEAERLKLIDSLGKVQEAVARIEQVMRAELT